MMMTRFLISLRHWEPGGNPDKEWSKVPDATATAANNVWTESDFNGQSICNGFQFVKHMGLPHGEAATRDETDIEKLDL